MPTFLHVACGPMKKSEIPVLNFREWGEVRLDIDDTYKPDIVGDMRDIETWGWNGSVQELFEFDGLYCSHALEHLHLFDVPQALKVFHTVLKPKGVLCIFVPNFQAACKFIAEGNENKVYDAPCGPIYAHDIVFGHTSMSANNPHMQHRCGFTPALLRGLILGAGFNLTDVQIDDLNIFMAGVKQ